MNVTQLSEVQHVQVYIVTERLREHLRPALLVRHLGVTIIYIDPRTPRARAVEWSVDNLTRPEREYLRAVLGQPPIGHPLEDWIMDDPVCEWFPPTLRLPEQRAQADRDSGYTTSSARRR